MSVFGWIIIEQHIGNSFNWKLPWADYKAGFGSINADFWLGLEQMHLLTSSQAYRLRVEVLLKSNNLWYSAEYWSFHIGDEAHDKYRLSVDGYSGDAGDALQYPGDYIGNRKYGHYLHDGMMFSTYDKDNDLSTVGCVEGRPGAWWFNRCFWACLTCNTNHQWDTLPGDHLVNSRMMIKPQ